VLDECGVEKDVMSRGDWRNLRGVTDHPTAEGDANGHRLGHLTLAADIPMRRTYWGWADGRFGRIPIGELTIVAGHGEAGKSTFNIELLSQVTRGDLPGHWFGVPQPVIIAASEDDWEKTIIPRLVAAGADLDIVYRFDVITSEYPDGTSISLPHDYGELESAIRREGIVWVFLDSVVGAIDIAKDVNHGQHVRAVLEPLADIARRQRCVIIGNVHFNKNTAGAAMERMSGSMEFRNVARAVIYLAMQDDGVGVISKQKNNLGISWPSIMYDIVEVLVDEEQEITAGRIRLKGETNLDAGEIINRRPLKKPSDEVAEVIEVLKDMFHGQSKWRATDAVKELEDAGVSTNSSTIKKARERLGIHVEGVYIKGKRGADHYVWTTGKIKVQQLRPI
jgi:hypothetical protein